MIGASSERGLVPHPCKCPQQPEQVGAIYIGPRLSLFLGADKEVRARRFHALTRRMKRRLRVSDCRDHRAYRTTIIMGDLNGFA